jgi:phosphoglycolate phosphatase
MPELLAVVFDLDGTLLDSAPDIRNAVNKTLAGFGRRNVTLNEIKSFVGDGMLTTLERSFAVTGEAIAPSESYARFQIFIQHYRALTADPEQIYPYVLPMLEGLRSHSIKIGLCTNKQEAATHQLLKQLNLADSFHAVAGGDTFPVHKPHPGHVQGILDQLGVAAENALMIGDSRNDIVAAKGAGVKSLVVTHGYGVDVASLGADGLIEHFADWREKFLALGFTGLT